jgi:hypothetical protein
VYESTHLMLTAPTSTTSLALLPLLPLQLQMSLPDVGALRLADTSGPHVGAFGPLPSLCRVAGAADARRLLDLPVWADEAVLALGLQVCLPPPSPMACHMHLSWVAHLQTPETEVRIAGKNTTSSPYLFPT